MIKIRCYVRRLMEERMQCSKIMKGIATVIPACLVIPLLVPAYDVMSSAVISVGLGMSLSMLRSIQYNFSTELNNEIHKYIKNIVDNTRIIVYNKTKSNGV